jgi:hypothetical protein
MNPLHVHIEGLGAPLEFEPGLEVLLRGLPRAGLPATEAEVNASKHRTVSALSRHSPD